jgi:hypothetical protein
MKEAGEVPADSAPASIHDIVEVAPKGWRESHGYDLCRRGCFGDSVFPFAPGLDKLIQVEFKPDLSPACAFWSMQVRGEMVELRSARGPWLREKLITFANRGSTANVHYRLSRTDGREYDGYLLMEFNLGLLAGDAPDRYHLLPGGRCLPLASKHEQEGVAEAVCIDEWTNVHIEISVDGAEWVGFYPVNTLSRGEGGLEMTYQGTCILFRVPLRLEGGSAWICDSKLTISPNR